MYTRKQLLAMGYDLAQVRRGVATGDLERLRNGWFAIRAHDSDVAIAVKAGGALACVSALKWHGLWVAPGYPTTHIRRTRRKEKIGSSCTAIGGPYPVTQPVDPIPLALACAARCMITEHWVAACDSYFQVTGETTDSVLAAIGHPGDRRLKKLFAMTDGKAQSGTESIVRVRLRALGLDVVTQPPLDRVGHTDLRVGMLLIECDGQQYHSDLAAYQNDRTRDRRSLVDGWITMRLTYSDVLFGWDEVEQDILAIVGEGRHRARTNRRKKALQKSLQLCDAEKESIASAGLDV